MNREKVVEGLKGGVYACLLLAGVTLLAFLMGLLVLFLEQRG